MGRQWKEGKQREMEEKGKERVAANGGEASGGKKRKAEERRKE